MEKLETKSVKTSLLHYILQKQDIRADLCLQQMCLLIYILKK